MSLYDQLSPEGKTLLREAHGFLKKGYDPVTHLVSGEALGTVSLHRCLPDGRMQHMRTVLFNGQADRNRLTMDVEARVTRDVDVFFEISCPGLDPEQLRESCWTLPGLTVLLSARAPRPEIRRVDEHTLRVVYPARQEDPASLRMHFDLEAELT